VIYRKLLADENSDFVEAFGRWKTLTLWKLWLMEGSRSVEALASRRL
jgi:hypothetical protein